MTAEQAAQRALDERGYVVIASDRLLSIGEMVPLQTTATKEVEQSDTIAVIVSRTTPADMDQQTILLGLSTAPKQREPYYYRAIAE